MEHAQASRATYLGTLKPSLTNIDPSGLFPKVPVPF